MPVKKTAFVVGALAGGSIAVAAMAGAGMKLPLTVYVSPATYLPVRVVIGGLRQRI